MPVEFADALAAATSTARLFADLLIELKDAGAIDERAIKRLLNANEEFIETGPYDTYRSTAQGDIVARLTERRALTLVGLHPQTQLRVRSRRSQGLPPKT